MAEFVRFFFSIGGLMAVLAAGFVWLFMRPKQLAPARFIVAVLAAYAIAAMYPASHAVASLLASGYRYSLTNPTCRPAERPSSFWDRGALSRTTGTTTISR